jgi:soluble lytic murein transglycosylase
MKLLVTLSLCVSTLLSVDTLDYQTLSTNSPSRVNDFYTLVTLEEENLKNKEAFTLVMQSMSPRRSHLKALHKRVEDEGLTALLSCLKSDEYTKMSSACLKISAPFRAIKKLAIPKQRKIAKKLYTLDDEKRQLINLSLSKKLYSYKEISGKEFWQLLAHLESETFLSWIFPWFTHKHLKGLSKEKEFSAIIERVAVRSEYKPLYHLLVTTRGYHTLSYKSSFYLAMMAIQLAYPKNALYFLKIAQKRAWSREAKDKITFWLYQLTQEKRYLELLNQSQSVNIYTLFAKKSLNKRYDFIRSSIVTQKQKGVFPTPLEWLDIYSHMNVRSTAQKQQLWRDHNYSNMTQYSAYFENKDSSYARSYFLMPYEKELHSLTVEERAYIYAIARQESRFIAPSLSYSYAMGIMQLMPFVSRAIAKNRKERLNIIDMFDTDKNLEYGMAHLKWLRGAIEHPLFQAYAYNAGYGFTTRLLKKRALFRGVKYDPYLSMELIINEQAREYGKHVLCNYYIYRALMKDRIHFDTLMDIKNPF